MTRHNNSAHKPIIAITMGDAAGVGPELIVKVLAEKAAWDDCRPFIIGAPATMRDACGIVGANLRLNAIQSLSEASFSWSVVDILCPQGVQIDHVERGRVDPAAGKAAGLCLQKAFELAMDGEVQGVVSAPLNKQAFYLAGYQYPDELAYMADLTRSTETFILGVAGGVLTVAVAEHVAFSDIPRLVKKDKILSCIRNMQSALNVVGFAEPRIGVAALNVHAGEGGRFGREEIDEIEPAIQEARSQGMDVYGPVPADAVFVRALAGDFDGVVFMYHDQANIARKLQPRETGATIFMGLPVVCGTTAHGTAFNIAGQGIADPGSLRAALRHTVLLSSLAGG